MWIFEKIIMILSEVFPNNKEVVPYILAFALMGVSIGLDGVAITEFKQKNWVSFWVITTLTIMMSGFAAGICIYI